MPPGKLEMPDYFGAEEKACWKFIVSAVPAGLLTRADTQCVERAAVGLGNVPGDVAPDRQHRASCKDGRGAAARNPLIIRRQASEDLARATADLGLSPLARTRLVESEPEDDDPMAILLCVLGEPRGSRSAALATGARHSMPCLPVPRPISLSHRPSLVRPHLVVKAPLVRWHGLEADRVANALQRAVSVPPVKPCSPRTLDCRTARARKMALRY